MKYDYKDEKQKPKFDYNRVVANKEKAIQNCLALITEDKTEQATIYDTITSCNFNTVDMTYKPICDKLREMGYEIAGGV